MDTSPVGNGSQGKSKGCIPDSSRGGIKLDPCFSRFSQQDQGRVPLHALLCQGEHHLALQQRGHGGQTAEPQLEVTLNGATSQPLLCKPPGRAQRERHAGQDGGPAQPSPGPTHVAVSWLYLRVGWFLPKLPNLYQLHLQTSHSPVTKQKVPGGHSRAGRKSAGTNPTCPRSS